MDLPRYELPEQLTEAAEVSFLAADPSQDDVYTVYGHAGLRVRDEAQGLDLTFNYGIFNFSDGFLVRYIQGKTDYMVMPMNTRDYLEEYMNRGGVTEVVLATDSLQRADLWHRLLVNLEPANQVYRYNAFRDNCSTRPLQLYLESLAARYGVAPESIHWTLDESAKEWRTPMTWRERITQLESRMPWLVVGTDLAMGPALDEPMTLQERCFIPSDAAAILSQLTLTFRTPEVAEVKIRPVTSSRYYEPSAETMLRLTEAEHAGASLWDQLTNPRVLGGLLCLYGLFALYRRVHRRTLPGAIEWLMFLASGLSGLLLCYISWFSEHPMVYPNWTILALTPLHLLLVILQPLRRLRLCGLRRALYILSLLSACLFPVMMLVSGQRADVAIYLFDLALGLMLLSRVVSLKLTNDEYQEA